MADEINDKDTASRMTFLSIRALAQLLPPELEAAQQDPQGLQNHAQV